VISALHITLLHELADADAPRSGDALAQALAITRARVSQLVSALNRTYGANTITVSRAGYACPWLGSMLDAKICAVGTKWHVEVDSVLASTNQSLMDAGALHAHALLAEVQTAGRGRRGRSWQALPCGSVLLSVAWQFPGGAATLSGLSLSVGVAVARALCTYGANGVQLKWPNDIVWRGQKCGGVLIELSGDALGPTTAVIGIGLNVHLPAAAREQIDQPVTDVSTMSAQTRVDRNMLVNHVLRALQTTLEEFQAHGFATHAREWRALHAHEGKPTRVLRPDGSVIEAEATTVDDTGALVLKRGSSTFTVHSAEVSLRTP
jgi:BirA family transcriptional regulator, biotin operon repressor / biotin---[acetyl-CoA-carboxylase] ligase